MRTLRLPDTSCSEGNIAVTSTTSGESDDNGASQVNRRGRRIPLSCRLFFFGDDDFEGEATVLDVSTNGCRAESAIELKIGMVLKLSMFLTDFKWPLRVDQAIVRWIEGKQFGLEFTSIRLAQRERLRGLIMKVR
jgi:hypothetical protein